MIISLEVVRANENAFVNGVHFNLQKFAKSVKTHV